MRRYGFFVVGFLFAFLTATAFAADEASPVDQYKQDRLAKRAYERFLYAKEMLEQSPDVAIVSEAVQDAVRYATNKDEDTKALQAIESALERLPNDGGEWREAMLARGKMLTRLDRKDEAEVFFQDAIKKNWQNAMWR